MLGADWLGGLSLQEVNNLRPQLQRLFLHLHHPISLYILHTAYCILHLLTAELSLAAHLHLHISAR